MGTERLFIINYNNIDTKSCNLINLALLKDDYEFVDGELPYSNLGLQTSNYKNITFIDVYPENSWLQTLIENKPLIRIDIYTKNNNTFNNYTNLLSNVNIHYVIDLYFNHLLNNIKYQLSNDLNHLETKIFFNLHWIGIYMYNYLVNYKSYQLNIGDYIILNHLHTLNNYSFIDANYIQTILNTCNISNIENNTYTKNILLHNINETHSNNVIRELPLLINNISSTLYLHQLYIGENSYHTYDYILTKKLTEEFSDANLRFKMLYQPSVGEINNQIIKCWFIPIDKLINPFKTDSTINIINYLGEENLNIINEFCLNNFNKTADLLDNGLCYVELTPTEFYSI